MQDINLSTKGLNLLIATSAPHSTGTQPTVVWTHHKALSLDEGAGQSQESAGSWESVGGCKHYKNQLVLSLLHWHPFSNLTEWKAVFSSQIFTEEKQDSRSWGL